MTCWPGICAISTNGVPAAEIEICERSVCLERTGKGFGVISTNGVPVEIEMCERCVRLERTGKGFGAKLAGYPLPGTSYQVLDHWSSFNFATMVHGLMLWFPEPKVAREVIVDYINAWVAVPAAGSALFVVPRILQREWAYVSRCVFHLGEFYPHDLRGIAVSGQRMDRGIAARSIVDDPTGRKPREFRHIRVPRYQDELSARDNFARYRVVEP